MHMTRNSRGTGLTGVSLEEYSQRSGGDKHLTLHEETTDIQLGSGARQMHIPVKIRLDVTLIVMCPSPQSSPPESGSVPVPREEDSGRNTLNALPVTLALDVSYTCTCVSLDTTFVLRGGYESAIALNMSTAFG